MDGAPSLENFFKKFYAKVMHFCAKSLLVYKNASSQFLGRGRHWTNALSSLICSGKNAFAFPDWGAGVWVTRRDRHSVVTNRSTYYLNTIANSQEFSLFKIVLQ